VLTTGLVRALEGRARLHIGEEPPEETPSSVILYASGEEDLSEGVGRHLELSPDSPPVLVFGSHLHLPLGRDALRAGASGFILRKKWETER
jgi:hypothetical protein